eukprot:RCo031150
MHSRIEKFPTLLTFPPLCEMQSIQKEIEALKRKIHTLEAEKSGQADAVELSQLDLPLSSSSSDIDRRSIYIGNVDYEAQPGELAEIFGEYGVVNRVTIMCNAEGAPKGYAYLEFADAKSVQDCQALDGMEFRGRPLKVMCANTRRVQNPRKSLSMIWCQLKRLRFCSTNSSTKN